MYHGRAHPAIIIFGARIILARAATALPPRRVSLYWPRAPPEGNKQVTPPRAHGVAAPPPPQDSRPPPFIK